MDKVDIITHIKITMKPTKEHFKKKKQNLIITLFILVIQILIIIMSLYFIRWEVSIYWNISIFFFLLGIPNLVFISTNLVMLYRWEWIYLRFSMDKIKFIDNPEQYLENTFPTRSIVLILLAFWISWILISL